MASRKNPTPASDVPQETTSIVVKFDVNEVELSEKRAEYAKIDFTTPEGYELGRRAIGSLRALRGDIEKHRKFLKADALIYSRKVDSAARFYTELVEEIEIPLQDKKEAVDSEKARARQAKEDAEREAIRLEAEAKLVEQREALAAAQRELADSEARAAEAHRLAREESDAREAAQAQQRAELEAERAAVAAEREAMAAERARFQAASIPPVTAREVMAPPEPPPSAVTQSEIDAALAQEIAKLPPVSEDWVSGHATDADALSAFARQIRALRSPEVRSETAAAILEQVEFMLTEAAQALESFTEEKGAASAAE